MEKQLELDAIPRKRVQLTEDKPQSDAHLSNQVAEEVRVPACPPNQAVAELWLGYTPWMKFTEAQPPVAGFYDFFDGEHGETGRVIVRKYFDPADLDQAVNMSGAPTNREWRGLAQAWPESFNPCLPAQPQYVLDHAASRRRRLLND